MRVVAAACVLAVVASGCPSSKPSCAGTCPSDMKCNMVTGACEPLPSCTTDGDCPDQGVCLSGTCSSCDTNILCTAGYVRCDPMKRACAACSSRADCAAPTPACAAFRCTECDSDTDCPADRKHCDADGKCSACAADAECPSGQNCNRGRCAPPCTLDTDCPAESPVCGYTGCQQCWTSLECAATESCWHGVCRPAPRGETCRAALPLPFSSGSVIAKGNFLQYSYEEHDLSITNDVWLELELTQHVLLNADVSIEATFFPEGGMSIHGSCAGDRLASGGSVRDLYVPPGKIYIRVYETHGVSFTLHVWTTPTAARPPGNHCLLQIPVTMGPEEAKSLTGDTRPLAAFTTPTCPGTSLGPATPKVAYDIELTGRSTLTARAVPLDPSYQPAIDLKYRCLDEDVRQCGAAYMPGQTASLTYWPFGPIGPGHWSLQLEDLKGTSGPYRLELETVAWASNDSCATATPLEFDAGVARGSGSELAQGRYCHCQNLICDDGIHFYSFSTVGQGVKSLLATVTADAGFEGFDIVQRCGQPDASVVDCSDRGRVTSATRDIPQLPEGDYQLEVASAQGPFDVELRLGASFPSPPNDDCPTAIVLDMNDAGSYLLSGDTRGAAKNNTSDCSASGYQGAQRDVVYELRSAVNGRVAITVTPTSSGYDPWFFLKEPQCSGFTSGVTCAAAAGPGGAESLATGLAAGYARYLWVSGMNGTSGTFDLSVVFGATPANDSCANAITVTVPATVSGNTLAASHEGNSCDSTTNTPDVFYRFVAGANGTVNITLIPSGFDARLHVLTGGCSVAGCTRTVNAAGAGGAETTALSVQRNIAYFIEVDGDSGGPFTLDLQ